MWTWTWTDSVCRDPKAFKRYSTMLLIAALSSGVFAGLRGSIFTVQMARLNTRIRRRLFDAILAQDIGFFDLNKTGDLSSRLNNDCSTVGRGSDVQSRVCFKSSRKSSRLTFNFKVLSSLATPAYKLGLYTNRASYRELNLGAVIYSASSFKSSAC